MKTDSRFIYVHDPMCSWCWGHRPVWRLFEAELAKRVPVEYRVGGLAPDSDEPMPVAQQEAIRGYWQEIHSLLGVPFNFDFWTLNTPRRSTYPACRAVLAARWQQAERPMIDAIQEGYYLRALNPSDVSTLVQLAEEIGLDARKFTDDLVSAALNKAFEQEIDFARRLPIQGFPSMVLVHEQTAYEISLDYKDYRGALRQVDSILGLPEVTI
ncbi:DsbA family protein [Reinekea sp. G2M2-21]|uniref:DsbA family protein n=1 Tax=Reinekea sp. G2M2-21 TaxID=2788942 RepID=UPI001E529FA1|nr:DsbA family protein [Reinekea sp. G2M2-21]